MSHTVFTQTNGTSVALNISGVLFSSPMNEFERGSGQPPLCEKNLRPKSPTAQNMGCGWGWDPWAQVISFWLLKETPGCLEVSGDLRRGNTEWKGLVTGDNESRGSKGLGGTSKPGSRWHSVTHLVSLSSTDPRLAEGGGKHLVKGEARFLWDLWTHQLCDLCFQKVWCQSFVQMDKSPAKI